LKAIRQMETGENDTSIVDISKEEKKSHFSIPVYRGLLLNSERKSSTSLYQNNQRKDATNHFRFDSNRKRFM
jgi:hypothetical protein